MISANIFLVVAKITYARWMYYLAFIFEFRKWGKATYDHLLSIIKTGDATKLGVELISGYYFFPKQKVS